jgi:hypothetical protein
MIFKRKDYFGGLPFSWSVGILEAQDILEHNYFPIETRVRFSLTRRNFLTRRPRLGCFLNNPATR